MQVERFKAENSDEIVWLRLNRLKSIQLCENLISTKLKANPNANVNESIIASKAIGLSSAIESAIGYWQVMPVALNAKILSRYYFLLQMTIAEQVSSIRNVDDLKKVQKHTEYGHGLATIINDVKDFPENFYIYALRGGHFYNYIKSNGYDIKDIAFDRRLKSFSEVSDASKVISIADLFRRIPELSKIVEEHLKLPTLAFHVGHSFQNSINDIEKVKEHINKTGKFTLSAPQITGEKSTIVGVYSESANITPDYLSALGLPLSNFQYSMDSADKTKYISGVVQHSSETQWWQHLGIYSSPYAISTLVTPFWTEKYDSILANLILLYGLSIIVRYLPDLWLRITTGDLNHIGSLIEYYVSVMDHVLPLQMLERISGTQIEIHSQGSMFGEI